MGRRGNPDYTYIHPYISKTVAEGMKQHVETTGLNVSRQIEAAWTFWIKHQLGAAVYEQQTGKKTWPPEAAPPRAA